MKVSFIERPSGSREGRSFVLRGGFESFMSFIFSRAFPRLVLLSIIGRVKLIEELLFTGIFCSRNVKRLLKSLTSSNLLRRIDKIFVVVCQIFDVWIKYYMHYFVLGIYFRCVPHLPLFMCFCFVSYFASIYQTTHLPEENYMENAMCSAYCYLRFAIRYKSRAKIYIHTRFL